MKIVSVKWVDSREDSGGWDFKDGLEQLKPVYVRSVGFLFADNDDFITLVQSDSSDQINGMITIPRGCIQGIDVLEDIR